VVRYFAPLYLCGRLGSRREGFQLGGVGADLWPIVAGKQAQIVVTRKMIFGFRRAAKVATPANLSLWISTISGISGSSKVGFQQFG
jgi:hypothetical protein